MTVTLDPVTLAVAGGVFLLVLVVAGVIAGMRGRGRGPDPTADGRVELERIEARVAELTETLRRLDAQRSTQFGQVTEQLREVTRTHAELSRTAGELREAFASPQARGLWGERMAEDVLRAAGMVDGVNYVTQRTTRAGTRPDVTLLLPHERVVHLDVKFPLTRYLDMLRTDDPGREAEHRAAFLRAVRDRVRELDGRGYIDPDDGTLDCVLLFIPNDRIYDFLQEHDPSLFDDALSRRVVICAPTTLFAVLAIVRQATEQAALERTSEEILEVLGEFSTQWNRFTDVLDRLGRGIDQTQRAFEALTTTRRTGLERQLGRIDDLRRRRVDADGS
ncbi:MAG: DNA recombination protein RmuC [Nitriliruptoraceae bacterium]